MNTPEFSALVPMLPVTDVARTIAFYEQLGFTIGNPHTPEGLNAPVWAWLYSGRSHLMINQAEEPVEGTHTSASLWLYCADVGAMHELLKSRGLDAGDISYPPYNIRGEFHVHDPDGYAVFVAQAEP